MANEKMENEQENDRRVRALKRIALQFTEMNIGKELTQAAMDIWEDGYRVGRAEGFAAATRKETSNAEG